MTHINNRQKKGISVVLTTLIIVVASVVLGTAVTLFGTSLFQTGAQNQGMSVTNSHLWFTSSSYTEGAAAVRNTGDKLIAVDNIKVRGGIVPFANWAYVPSTDANIVALAQSQLVNCGDIPTTLTCDIDGATPAETLIASGPVSLDPGKTVIVYFKVPNGLITAADIGASATMTIQAGQITSVQSVSVAQP